MQRPGLLAAALLVAGLAVAVALPSLDYGFVYDDEAVILERKPFWEVGLADFLRSRPVGTGRHLTAVSLDLDRLEAGAVPRPFHRTNVVLAGLLAVLVLLFACRVGMSLAAATAAAALFAVHPVHVDAVVALAGRAELLAAVGVIAAMLLAVRPETETRHPSMRIAVGSMLLATLALHAKENALCLPLLVALATLFLGRRVAVVPSLAGIGVAISGWAAVAGPLLVGLARPQLVDNPLVYAPVYERFVKALAILWDYSRLLVWPHPLLLDRSYATTDPTMAAGVVAVVAWAVAAIAVWRLRKSHAALAFALAWFPAAFALTGNYLRPVGTLMAERLLLLPSLSVCLAAGIAVDALPARQRRLALGLVVAIVAVFFSLFRERAEPWRSPETYFAASAAASPDSAKAQYDYGTWLLRKDRPLEAEAAFARALAIVPSLSRAAWMRAESMGKRGDPAAGVEVYLEYLTVEPQDTGAITNLVRLLLQAHRPREARQWAQQLVGMQPGDRSAMDLLIVAEGAVERADRPAAPQKPAPVSP